MRRSKRLTALRTFLFILFMGVKFRIFRGTIKHGLSLSKVVCIVYIFQTIIDTFNSPFNMKNVDVASVCAKKEFRFPISHT